VVRGHAAVAKRARQTTHTPTIRLQWSFCGAIDQTAPQSLQPAENLLLLF